MDPAPLDPDALAGTLAPFGHSTGLPAAAYHSPDVFSWEHDRFFNGTWFCVGRVDDLVRAGQVRGIQVRNETAIVVRDGKTIRAFSNVCRHRGHELLPVGEARDARLIRCPYHAWTYRLDGSLMTAPTFSNPIAEADYPLIPIRVETWGGWVFVNIDGSAPALEEHVGNLNDLLSTYRMAGLAVAHQQNYIVAANWKVIVENFNECYHCISIHPALCEVTPVGSGADLEPTGLWWGGTMDLKDHAATMSIDGTTPQPPLPGRRERPCVRCCTSASSPTY